MPARIVVRRKRTAGLLPAEREGEFIIMKTRIMVLFGGNSSEYEVSLQSGAAVLDALDRERYEVFPVGITRQGRWLAYSGTTEEIRQDTWEAHLTAGECGCRRSRRFTAACCSRRMESRRSAWMPCFRCFMEKTARTARCRDSADWRAFR